MSTNRKEYMKEYMRKYRVDKVNREKVKLLQVIPPTRPEYKVGDLIMIYPKDRWEWPLKVTADLCTAEYMSTENKVFYNDVPNCKYFEWVQYNPLSTAHKDESA